MGILCYAILLLAAGSLCLLRGSTLLLAAMAALLLLPLLWAIFQLCRRKTLRVSISASSNLEQGKEGTVTITLHNEGFLPLGHGKCRLRLKNLLTEGETLLELDVFAPAKGKREFPLKLGSAHCGRVQIQVERLRLYDPFGLIGIRCKCNAAAHVTVQPRGFVQTIWVSADASCPDDSPVYSQQKPGYDLSEVWQLREYQPGDSPRQIHWKLSSKLDKMVIREPSLPVRRSVLVFWERTQKSTPAETDAQADVLISVCRTLLEDGISFTLAWNDWESGGCVMQELRSMDDFAALLPRLLSARPAEGASGAEVLCRSCGEASISHILYLCNEVPKAATQLSAFGRVTVLSCNAKAAEQGAIAFDIGNYQKQLAELEL